MKKIIITSLLVGTSLFANNIEKKDDGKGGYTYIGFGTETISYKESFYSNSLSSKVESDVNSTSPVYLSGSLTKVNDTFDFSIDAASTLTTTESSEKWSSNTGVVQQNQFNSILSDLKILVHYKLSNEHRITVGPKFSSFIVKRNTYKDANGNYVVYTDPITSNSSRISANEENVSTLFLNLGYWYESSLMNKEDYRVKVAANFGQPIWRNASNTGFEYVEFDSTTGYSYDVSAYVGYKVVKGLEVGVFGEYIYTIKKDGDKTTAKDDSTKSVTWPENELSTTRLGLMFAWNF